MVILKVTKNKGLHSLQRVYFLKYILRVILIGLGREFFNETSTLAFLKLTIFHSILIRTSLGQIARKITT